MDALVSLGRNFFYIPQLKSDGLGFETMQQKTSASWVSQGRLSRDPAMQFTGPGNETISIAGRVYPEFFGGLTTLGQLRTDLRAGKPLTLIRYIHGTQSVTGNVSGNRWVIMDLTRAESKLGADGIPNRVDFTLELQRYGDDTSNGGPLALFAR